MDSRRTHFYSRHSTRDAPREIYRARRDELEKAGVPEDMVRLSIGLEHVDDILADVTQALAAAV